MTYVFGASVSPSRIPFNHHWVGCISHQLSTGMNTVIQSEKIQDSDMHYNLTTTKSIIDAFKHASYNEELNTGYKKATKYRQDSERRFMPFKDLKI